jgi:hypothetical protein
MARSRGETAVRAQKGVTRLGNSRHNRSEHLKDEVYRQMFRLEARRPRAEMDLAIALRQRKTVADKDMPNLSDYDRVSTSGRRYRQTKYSIRAAFRSGQSKPRSPRINWAASHFLVSHRQRIYYSCS